MITDEELDISLKNMAMSAVENNFGPITVEHLLLELLHNSSTVKTLMACSANIDKLRKSLTTFVEEKRKPESMMAGFYLIITKYANKAQLYMESDVRTDKITGFHMLLAIFDDNDSHAVKFLHQCGVTQSDAIMYLDTGT